MFLAKDSFNTNVENTLLTSDIELLHIVLQLPSTKPINLISVYRSPNSHLTSFFADFSQFLNNIAYCHLPLLIMGDFNIDVHQTTSSSYKQFIVLLKDYGLCIIGSDPTRVTFKSATQIDLVICNLLARPFVHCHQSSISGMSDHNLLSFRFKKPRPIKNPPKIVTVKSLNHDLLPTIKQCINNINLGNILSPCADNSVHAFMTELNKLIDSITISKMHKISDSQHPWISYDFKKLCQHRDRLFHLANKNKSIVSLHKARQVKNQCTNLSRSLKKQYISKKLELYGNNPKKIWCMLKPFYTDKDSSNTLGDKLLIDGKIVADHTIIANHFNLYFINSINDMHNQFSQIGLPRKPFQCPVPISFFSFSFVDVPSIKMIINKIKVHGKTNQSIHPMVLSACSNELASHFASLINHCFELSSFPSQWKQADVVPVYKSGSKLDVCNYRPISILPNTSKIIEHVMHHQISAHLNANNILPPCQHGFRQYHSTTTCAVDLLNFVNNNIAAGKHVIAVFLDFSKAFDLLSHDILIEKLKWLKFSTAAIELVKSYLDGRTQRVYSVGVFSRLVEVILGVPQGSILGPLLFAIYIHDMGFCVNHSILFQFADDTNVVMAHDDINVLVDLINHDIGCIEHYCSINKIKINPTKTKAMYFSCRKTVNVNNIAIFTGGSPVEFVDNFKFLGIHIDSGLTFKHHIGHVIGKLSSCSYIMLKCRNFLPKSILVLLFNAIGATHVNYGIVAYLYGVTNKLFNQLESRFVDCGRIILNNQRGSSRTATLSSLNWLPLKQHLFKCMLLFIFKIKFNKGPCNLFHLLPRPHHNHITRSSRHNCYLPIIKSSREKKSFFFWGPSIWNSLPPHVQTCTTLSMFDSALQLFISNNIII